MKMGGMEISEDLCDMSVHNRFACLYFNDKAFFGQKVYEILPRDGTVFIMNLHRFLLFTEGTFFPQSMRRSILIHLLRMTMPQVHMRIESSLTDVIA